MKIMTLKTNTKEFTRLKLSILGFGIFTLPEIIVMLFQFIFSFQVETILDYGFLSTLQFVCFVIVIFGFLVITLGLYSFSTVHEKKKENEIKLLSILLLIFFISILLVNIYGFFISLIVGDFHMPSTIMEIANRYFSNNKYRDWARLWAIFNVILYFYLFLLMVKFSMWFNDEVIHKSARGTYFIVLSSGFYLFAAIFTLISVAILFPPISFYTIHPLNRITDLDSLSRIIPLEDVIEAQLISYFFILFGLISQFVICLKLYLNLNNLSSVDSKPSIQKVETVNVQTSK